MKKKLILFTVLFSTIIIAASAPFVMDGIVDLNALFDYRNQNVPAFITENTIPADNQLDDKVATLGRVLFYDKQLSLNSTVSCASCHNQQHAFGDNSVVSKGFDGHPTERHSMRLVNLSFKSLDSLFWDRRGSSLEDQPMVAIANPVEMGFSGTQGQPNLDSLVSKLSQLTYYETLFDHAYGDETVSVNLINIAIAQFLRSISSFDSKFDEGRAMVNSAFDDFPNFTDQENFGKSLFISPFPPIIPPFIQDPEPSPFFGCSNCHGQSSFAQTSGFRGNNGVVGVAGDSTAIDISVVRSPSLRNMFTPDGNEIGPFMHDGSLKTLRDVLKHYAFIPHNPLNTNQSIGVGGFFPEDHRRPMSEEQEDALIAFMKTLTGSDIYTNPKWSNPFDENNNIDVIGICNGSPSSSSLDLTICEGEVIMIDGQEISEAGEFTYVLNNHEGCDSTVTLNVETISASSTFIDEELCQGQTLEVGGEIFDENNPAGTVLLSNAIGCDSIVEVNLSFIESPNQFINDELCPGESLQIGVLIFDESNPSGVVTFPNSMGCDSIVEVSLTYLDPNDPACLDTSSDDLENLAFNVYPNPISTMINIESKYKHDSRYKIYGMDGRKVKDGNLSAHEITMVDMQSVTAGLYLIHVTDYTGNQLFSYRMLK